MENQPERRREGQAILTFGVRSSQVKPSAISQASPLEAVMQVVQDLLVHALGIPVAATDIRVEAEDLGHGYIQGQAVALTDQGNRQVRKVGRLMHANGLTPKPPFIQ